MFRVRTPQPRTQPRFRPLASALVLLAGLVASPAALALGAEATSFRPQLERHAPRDAYPAARPGASLLDTALFRFIEALPVEPVAIGPAPKLPRDPEPTLGLVFVIAFD